MKKPSFLYICFAIGIIAILYSCSKSSDLVITTNINQSANVSDLIATGDSVVIRGDTSYGFQTALIQSRKQPYLRDNNYINFPAYNGVVWTWDGEVGIERSLMKFNLPPAPQRGLNSPPVIVKALLYLYQYQRNDGLDIYGVNQTVSNTVELHRITGNWNSSTVTWNNQPALAKGSSNPLEDVITISPVATPLALKIKDNITIDVTAMVQKMISENKNEGFMLKITDQNENHPYCGRSFGSFACPEKNKKPRLVIYY